MNFNDVFSQLLTRQGREFGAGLPAFSKLLLRLKNPQKKIKIIHVAGTNGKGSVCTLLARVLTCSGEKTGLFVSPHLVSPTERICVDGMEISPNDFARCVQKVLACEKEKLNFFEILTAAALVYFAEKKCTYAVLETGLGGRKDPTSACTPRACVITSVGLDHTQLLGRTLKEIAREKAGIIKRGVPVWCGPVPPTVRAVLTKIAKEKNAPICFVKNGTPFTLQKTDLQRGFSLLKKEKNVYPLHLLGKFQPVNACVVYHVARALNVDETALFRAFETVQIPGRFEIFRRGKNTVILDGAHNPQAVAALLDFWQKTVRKKNAALVCGFMKDKDFKKMLSVLAPHFQKIFLTLPCDAPRAAGEKELRPFLLHPGVAFVPDAREALTRAQKSARIVLCTGSFYLIGALRKQLHKQ